MKVDTRNHTTVIKDTQGDLAAFLVKVTNEFTTFHKNNIIIDLSAYDALPVAQVSTFLPLAKSHGKAKKSFIVVANTEYNNMGKLIVVPTLLEAHDMIDMDEIERDLGF
jgi:hypothetical protein